MYDGTNERVSGTFEVMYLWMISFLTLECEK